MRRRFGSPGSGRGQFSDVRALAISGRELAVADGGNGKIEFFRVPDAGAPPEPERLAAVRQAAAAPLECERAYAFAPGELLCLDARNHRVTRLDARGSLKLAFPGRVDYAKHAAFDSRDIAISDGSSVKIFSLRWRAALHRRPQRLARR